MTMLATKEELREEKKKSREKMKSIMKIHDSSKEKESI